MAKKKKRKSKKDEEDDSSSFELDLGLSQETKNGIWSVISFGLAVVVVLALLDKAGRAGEIFDHVIKLLFGWGAFLFPVALVMLGVSFLRSIHRQIYKSAVIGTVLFVISFLSLFYILGPADQSIADRIDQGGYLGLPIGYGLLEAVGFVAALIILIFLLIISILVALNIPVYRLLFKAPEEAEEGDEDGEDVSQEEDMEEEQEKDNVVIRRGAQVLDERAMAAAEARKKMPELKSTSEEEREFVIKSSKSHKWVLPPLNLLHADGESPRPGDINASVNIIKRTLSHFGINVEMGEVSIGPTVTQFTLRPAVGVKLSRITALSKDLALALAAPSIRIEAPIPGKALVGIEVPNAKSAIVGLRDVFEANEYKKSKTFLPLGIGRDVAGYPVIAALEKMPHLLIAGATGTGKSVTINTILLSLLYKHSPDMLKLILVDPKRVELSLYNEIPHLITPVIVDTKKVVNALKWAVREMEQRYQKLSEEGSRDIFSYNTKRMQAKEPTMPMIVIVIDELADLMASHGRDVEAAIVRLAQMARAVGIHLIVSTQRPSVEVITGLIKANITSRIALQVASQIDSRTILDSAGAEKLLGNGDMLYQSGATGAKLTRVQGALVTEKEVKDVVDFIRKQADELLDEEAEEAGENSGNLSLDLDAAVAGGALGGDDDVDDDMFPEAKQVVIESQKASASFLQRRLRVGYARAARLLDLLEEKGIIGPGEGAKPREVYVKADGSVEATADEAAEAMDEAMDDSQLS